jgi:hypothetical protein
VTRLVIFRLVAGVLACAPVGAAQESPRPAPPAPGAPPPTPEPAPAPTKPGAPAPAVGQTEVETTPRPDGSASAQNQALADEMTPELDGAVARGLDALAKLQNPDGSFGQGRYGRNVAVTALSAIALMADGNIPGRGPHGKEVEKALEFILANSNEIGLLAGESASGPMYGHGFGALFLGEVYGMLQGGPETPLARRTHEALVKSIRLIERTQNEEGGWRYNPVPYDADVSVTICQVMALRSARNAGIEVSKDVIDKAVQYVRRCQNPDGGWRYQTMQGMSLWPRSAAGVATLFYAGIYEDNAIEKGIKYLLDTALPGSGGDNAKLHYFYGQYYAVQAMYLAGGDAWKQWWPAIRTELMASQMEDGTWADPSVGTAYGTAMSLIVLQMPKRYLPIFQK